MYGTVLARGPQGQVGCGLGPDDRRPARSRIIVPTVDITTTGETHTVDGVEIEFQMAPGTEAPAEMHFYFPKFRALCMAENATHNLHNLLTLRGALVRDPHAWSGYLTEAIDTFADRTDVVFASHHWPTWGRERHRRIPFPATGSVRLPARPDAAPAQPGLHRHRDRRDASRCRPRCTNAWHTHGYYGSVSHNVKAVYQRYMGWFDGNPARLWPHPPEAIGPRYVEAMGGIDRVVELAQTAFDAGDFRWAATLLDHAIFTDENHAGSPRAVRRHPRAAGATAPRTRTWRNFFLSGATELRDGNFGTPTPDHVDRRCWRSSPRSRCSTPSRSASTGRGPGISTSPST